VQADSQLKFRAGSIERRDQLRAVGVVVLCLVVVLGVFSQSFVQMVRIWGAQSDTYSHGYLVLPIFVFLVWQRRAVLADTPIKPFVPAVAAVAGAGFIWLLGEVAGVSTVSFVMVVSMVALSVAAVLGLGWARVLMFPLAILLFAVPFGEDFVPRMMQWTADFTVTALRMSGVPTYREGMSFVIPSGRWSVVEACSGIRYLVASVFAGTLFAWQMYRSPGRRVLFVLCAIIVPIVANWLRAYLIVMLGHLSDGRLASGVDHLIYGWVFFGLVIGIMFAVGAIWREDKDQGRPGFRDSGATGGLAFPSGRVVRAAGLTVAVFLGAQTAAAFLLQPLPRRSLASVSISPVKGWTPIAMSVKDWHPYLQAPSSEQSLAFAKDGQEVGVFVGIFRDQRQGAELVSSVNQLGGAEDRKWKRVATAARIAPMDGRTLPVQMETLQSEVGTIVAWRWYCLDRMCTSSDYRAKFYLAVDRLARRDDTSAWVAIYVINPATPAEGERALATFSKEMGGALERAVLGVISDD
jgi:exosortase A